LFLLRISLFALLITRETVLLANWYKSAIE
jgi:hypothetical protein